MISRTLPRRWRYRLPLKRNGFALIVTLVLMMLVTILAISLLQLSSITLRISERDRSLAEARANARTALTMALGQLQREMGPDRRISAPAGLQDSDPSSPQIEGVANPRFTGVWEAGEEATAANMDKRPEEKSLAFRRWLVSGDDSASYEFARQASLKGTSAGRTAVGAGSVADPVDQVSVPVIDGDRAGFAWWISDDGQKATVRGTPPEDQKKADLASTLAGSRRLNSLGHHALDPRMPSAQEDLRRLPDFATTDVATDRPASGGDFSSRRYFHDLTAMSELVPVDVTAGRLKRCLNLWLEWLEQQDADKRAAAGTLGPMASASRDYRTFSWDQLRNAMNYGRDPRMLTFGREGGRPQVTAYQQKSAANGNDDPEINPDISRDRWRIQPVLLKTVYIVSYSTERTARPPDPGKPERSLALRFHIYPVVVLWNPYNVDLVVPEYVSGSSPLPVVFKINAGGETTEVDWVERQASVYAGFGPEAPQKKLTNLLIPAGATRVLYPQKFDPANPSFFRSRFPYDFYFWMDQKAFDCGPGNYGAPLLNLKDSSANHYSFVSSPGHEIAGRPQDPLSISIRPSTLKAVSGLWPLTYQWYGEHSDWHGNNGSGSDDLKTTIRFGSSTASAFRFQDNSPQISVIAEGDVPSRTFGELEGRPTPLFIFECHRKALDEELFPSKNWAFSMPANPFHAGTGKELGNTDPVTPWFESAYTFDFKAVNSWVEVSQSMQLPPDRDNEAYLGTSYGPAGQLRAIAEEIPLVPPVSLAQLQHLPLFDYRPEGPIEDPFGYRIDFKFHRGRVTQFPQNNAIGNSFASPGIPSSRISDQGWKFFIQDVSGEHLRLDRSYIANRLLWDSWWCSSLAPQDGPFYQKYGESRSLATVAKDFMEGRRPLPNEGCAASLDVPPAEAIGQLFENGGKLRQDAHLRLASLIRIRGGFNVNSVSVTAWEHLFSQLLSRPMVSMTSANATGAPAVAQANDGAFLVSRFTFQSGGAAEQASGRDREDRWWDGCRELTAEQIRALAEATVREVKLRGPFLSLAEFVNRSLSNDTALALSGPLQAALDSPGTGINDAISDLKVPPPPGAAKPRFRFPAAAEGPLRQGIPGYVTQADLLQVIGPSLAPRSDTFTIRAMGESRDADGAVLAREWCECVVQRDAAYLISDDAAHTAFADLQAPLNQRFGRRFRVVSFRWLSKVECS